MARQPYIPLYIGDWTQDTDTLSIEAEGAWLRIIFKCWRNEGSFTATPEIMARVCKLSPEKFVSVLLEWEVSNICEITRHENGLLTLKNRRITRDVEISAKRALSGKKGMEKRYQNTNKTVTNIITNTQQNTDIDNDIVIENGIKSFGKSENLFEPLSDEHFAFVFDELTMSGYKRTFRNIDIDQELKIFIIKARGAPDDYRHRDTGGIRNALLHQLKTARPNGTGTKQTNKGTEHAAGLVEGFKRRNGAITPGE